MDTHYERVKGAWEERFERRYGFWRGLALMVATQARNVIDIAVFMLGLSSAELTGSPTSSR